MLHLSSLAQSEIMGQSPGEPFSLELPLLSNRQKMRTILRTPEIFQRIYQGGMPALVSGAYTNSSIFPPVILIPIWNVMCDGSLMI